MKIINIRVIMWSKITLRGIILFNYLRLVRIRLSSIHHALREFK